MKTSNLIRLTHLSKESRMMGTAEETEEARDLNAFSPVDSIYGLIDLMEIADVKNKVIVEIGSYLGVSTETFLLHEPKKMYAIDPWGIDFGYGEANGFLPSGGWKEIEQKFRDRVKSYKNIEIIKNLSVKAAEEFEEESLDFVYIDGNHDSCFVAQDIEIWWPKIKQNGYMGGHDFYVEFDGLVGVEATVYNYFGHQAYLDNHVKAFSDSSWLFKKIKA